MESCTTNSCMSGKHWCMSRSSEKGCSKSKKFLARNLAQKSMLSFRDFMLLESAEADRVEKQPQAVLRDIRTAKKKILLKNLTRDLELLKDGERNK